MAGKTRKLLALTLCTAALAALGVAGGCTAAPNESAALGPLLSCSHNASGDMNGNLYSATLERAEDGSMALVVLESPDHMTPATVSTYRADDDALDQMRAIIDRYDMTRWDDLPMSDMFPLDAAGRSITMRFDDGEGFWDSYTVDYYSELPEEGPEAFDAFLDCLFQWATPERLVDQHIMVEDADRIEEGALDLL